VSYAKESLGLAARIGKTAGYGGIADNIEKPQFATAVGLMLIDSEGEMAAPSRKKKAGNSISNATGVISRFMARFKA
jgi:cell division ATPase FtsA